MRFKTHYSLTKGELNIAPLVDIVLQQLIYFMLTSSFIMQPGIKVKLPQAVSTERVEKIEVFVNVTADGRIFFKDSEVTLEQLGILLSEEAKKSKEITLVIKGDEKALHGRIVKVMDKARNAGIEKIAIATMPELE